MNTENMNYAITWKIPPMVWVIGIASLPLIWLVFSEGITQIVRSWEQEEYSHGYFIPLISLFLIWQKKAELEATPFTGSWAGVVLVLVGVALYTLGNLSAVSVIVGYGFLVTVFGIVLAYTGAKVFKLIAIPLALLLFMIPLPGFLYQSLSNELQLISSQIGVAFIRLFGISVLLEGNVVDLGTYKLQVVEACSGLRYLFPLLTLGFIAAYFFKVALWKRLVVFLSTIPITILMNSARIGIIGITVEYWGVEMAEGILHDFEGWFVFMASIAVLVGEMVILAKIGRDPRSLVQVFGLELPEPTPRETEKRIRPIPKPYITAVGTLAFASIAAFAMPDRTDVIPERKSFTAFPKRLGDWVGQVRGMEQIYIDALNFDDYLMATYSPRDKRRVVGLYAGYYATQRADKVPHSPKACLPGGGWAITALDNKALTGLHIGGVPLQVNRVVIEKGEYKQLVYYWFQQRERVITNEWFVKLYLLVDAIRESRTDGALLRLTTQVLPGEDMGAGDKRLTDFASQIAPILPEFIPD